MIKSTRFPRTKEINAIEKRFLWDRYIHENPDLGKKWRTPSMARVHWMFSGYFKERKEIKNFEFDWKKYIEAKPYLRMWWRSPFGARVHWILCKKKYYLVDFFKTGRNNTKPKISIVVCTADQEDSLRACLKSLVDQETEHSFEVHVCDDGSIDVLNVVSEFKQELDISYHILFPRSNKWRLSASRNMGLRFARADRVLLIDSDTVLFPNVVDGQAEYGAELVIVGGRRREVSEENVKKVFSGKHRVNEIAEQTLFKHKSEKLKELVCTCLKEGKTQIKDPNPKLVSGFQISYPRNELLKLGGFWEVFKEWGCEETEVNLRMKRKRVRLLIRLDLVSYHLNHATNVKSGKCFDVREKIKRTGVMVANGTPVYEIRSLHKGTIKLSLFEKDFIPLALREISKYPKDLDLEISEKYRDMIPDNFERNVVFDREAERPVFYDKDWQGIISVKP